MEEKKFCKYCGQEVPIDAVVCTHCGRQIEEIKGKENIVINQINNDNIPKGKHDKWVSFILCLLLGWLGAHRFYEGKIFTGLIYLCTVGLCGFGVLIDLIIILTKKERYY